LAGFLEDFARRPLAQSASGLTPKGLFIGPGQLGLEVALFEAAVKPSAGALQSAWNARRAGRATPVLIVALHHDKAWLAGPRGENLPVHAEKDVGAIERLFALWDIARDHVWDAWMFETDPANLQPKVRPLNQRVAEFLRDNHPFDESAEQINRALDILEAPWPRREEVLLREWFNDRSLAGSDKFRFFVSQILETGLEPFNQPKLLPPIEKEDIRLVCWMGITADATT
jgi:hypothetical protein